MQLVRSRKYCRGPTRSLPHATRCFAPSRQAWPWRRELETPMRLRSKMQPACSCCSGASAWSAKRTGDHAKRPRDFPLRLDSLVDIEAPSHAGSAYWLRRLAQFVPGSKATSASYNSGDCWWLQLRRPRHLDADRCKTKSVPRDGRLVEASTAMSLALLACHPPSRNTCLREYG